MSEFEKEIQERKLAERTKIRKNIFATIYSLPFVIIGFSEMYFPKYKAGEWFWYGALGLLLVSVSYLFRDEVELLFKIYKSKNEKES